MSSGKEVEGLRSTQKEDGAINLEEATGVISGKSTESTKHIDFQTLVDEAFGEYGADGEIHASLKNLRVHKKNGDGLA